MAKLALRACLKIHVDCSSRRKEAQIPAVSAADQSLLTSVGCFIFNRPLVYFEALSFPIREMFETFFARTRVRRLTVKYAGRYSLSSALSTASNKTNLLTKGTNCMESRIENSTTETELSNHIVDDLKAMVQRAEEKAVERAKAADRVIRDHPYQTVGLAFGLGLLIGVLAARRK
jgi:ElaB/YqjD/DUF883 family membrane-anchored ribosome-binding protein